MTTIFNRLPIIPHGGVQRCEECAGTGYVRSNGHPMFGAAQPYPFHNIYCENCRRQGLVLIVPVDGRAERPEQVYKCIACGREGLNARDFRKYRGSTICSTCP